MEPDNERRQRRFNSDGAHVIAELLRLRRRRWLVMNISMLYAKGEAPKSYFAAIGQSHCAFIPRDRFFRFRWHWGRSWTRLNSGRFWFLSCFLSSPDRLAALRP